MQDKVNKGVSTAIIAVTLFVVSEVIGGLVAAYLVRKYGFECPFAADKKKQ
jgi:hypothetical protein